MPKHPGRHATTTAPSHVAARPGSMARRIVAAAVAMAAIAAATPLLGTGRAHAVLAWAEDPCETRGGQRVFAPSPVSSAAMVGKGLAACVDGSIETHAREEHLADMERLLPAENHARSDGRGFVDLTITADGRGLYALRASDEVVATGTADPVVAAQARANPGGPPAVGLALTPSQRGFWAVDRAGRVQAAGDAPDLGSVTDAAGRPVVDIEGTRSGGGYWVLLADGTVRSFGDAPTHRPVVLDGGDRATGIARAPQGSGYWVIGRQSRLYARGGAEAEPLKECSAQYAGDAVSITSSLANTAGVDFWVTMSGGGICAFDGEAS